MCRYLIDPKGNAPPSEVRDASFVQIVNTALLPPGSYKPQQYLILELDINAHLPTQGSVRSYRLIAGTPEQFIDGEPHTTLRRIVQDAILRYELLDCLDEK
jgi:hypothetical protein